MKNFNVITANFSSANGFKNKIELYAQGGPAVQSSDSEKPSLRKHKIKKLSDGSTSKLIKKVNKAQHGTKTPIIIQDPKEDREKSEALKTQWLSNSNLKTGKIVYDNLADTWDNAKIAGVMGNSHLETGGWNYMHQINGPASGLFMMEAPARREYQKWLKANNLPNTQANEVNYIQHLMDSKSLSTPWSNLPNALPYINKARAKKGLPTFKSVEELQNHINSIPNVEEAKRQGLRAHWQHRGYTTEQAYEDWENGDVQAKTKAFAALYEKPGIPHWDRRYGAAEAIYNNLHLFDPTNLKHVAPIARPEDSKTLRMMPKFQINLMNLADPMY